VTQIHELLRKRRSGRAYENTRTLLLDDLSALLEAARWAPSGGNAQPWRYVVGIQGDAQHGRLLPLLEPGNLVWAQYAQVLLLTCAQVLRLNSAGQQVRNGVAEHDTGMANVSIALEAVNRGMTARMMGGYNKAEARVLLRSDESGIEPVCMMAIGYPADLSTLPDDIRERETAERKRKPIDDLLLRL
jgi:nitroreductase